MVDVARTVPPTPGGPLIAPCPKAEAQLALAGNQGPLQKVVPCDIDSITLSLAVEGKASVACTGTKHAASPPLAGVSDRVNALLGSHAAVIWQIGPAVIATASAPSARNRIDETNQGGIEAQAWASFTTAARCGHHPSYNRTPGVDPAKKDDDSRSLKLSVETREWSIAQIGKCLFRDGKFSEFIYGSSDEVVIEGVTCALPASGDPLGTLSGIARIAIADEWRGDWQWSEGFKIGFAQSSTTSVRKSYRDDTSLDSRTTTVTRGDDVTTTSTEFVTKNGELVHGSMEAKQTVGYGAKTIRENSWEASKEGSGAIDVDMKRWKSDQLDEDVAAKFKKAQEAVKDATIRRGLAINLYRNGTSVIGTEQLGEAIENVETILKTATDLLHRLVWLLESGAKAGIPVTLTFAIDLSATFLKANNYLRFWPEFLPPRRGGSYYIADTKTHFQLGVDITAFSVDVKPAITFQVQFVHKVGAALTIGVEGKFNGTGRVNYAVSDGMAAANFNFIGVIAASIKASGEASAISFYAKIEGEATSGIKYDYSIEFDGQTLTRQKQGVRSDKVTFQATARWGNKIWDYFGLRRDGGSWQWPKDGPFVWLEEGAMNRAW